MAAEPHQPGAGQHGFTFALRGYKPSEVDQAIAELRAHVDGLVAEREILSEQKNQLASRLVSAIRRTNELDTQVKHLSASADSSDGLSERIRVILELAAAEAKDMTAQARELLEQAATSRTELDQRRVQLDAERHQVLTSAQTEADQLRREASDAASTHRSEAEAEVRRILEEARSTAAAVVERAHRTAAADVDRLREHILGELPSKLNAVISDAVARLHGPLEGASTSADPAEAVVLPQQRQPLADPAAPKPEPRPRRRS
jgi:cell division septum initiation protein DivIVA